MLSAALTAVSGLPQSDDPVHLIVDDHKALVHAHAGLGQDLIGLGSHSAVDTPVSYTHLFLARRLI